MRLHTSHGKQFPHQQPNVVAVSGLHTLTILRSIVLFAFIALSGTALAQDWQVSITLHEAFSITNNSVLGDDSIYAKMRLSPSGPGAGEDVRCNTKRLSDTYNRHVFPEWVCTGTVSDSSGDSPLINITLELWNYLNVTSSRFDRHFDINPDFVLRDINMVLDPRNHDFAITGLPEWTTARCAEGKIRLEGFGGGDRGRVEFSVSASIPGAIDGDSDSDGLLDSWEICGTEGVDLPAMGADPYIKDLFVEADWMVDDDAIAPTDHSHEPPLQSLANAWHEFRLAPVTNPPQGITPTHPGIHLHVDVGDLYEDFAAGTLNIGDCTPCQDFDLNGNGTCESIDLDMDGRPDIGDFGGGGRIPGQEDTVMVGCLDTEEIGTIQRFNFDIARRGVFRYALFAHRYRDATNFSSGVACSVDLFTITLGTLFNGVSGNSGLPVIGSVDENTGTFLHELGHTLSLSHGGNEHKNYKPNYLSLMNYYFQFPGLGYDLDGDGLQDDLAGIDFNYDGAPDSQRFSYSNDRSRISIDESGLDETLGVQDMSAPGIWARAITRVGPSPVFNNAGRCILACNMIPVCRSNCLLPVLANGPIDWDRDGSAISPSESELANPPFPAGIQLDLNRNGVQDTLNSFFDYDVLQNGGLRPRSTAAIVGPGIEVPLAETHRRETLSIVPVADQATLMANCDRGFDGIDFEGFPPGTIISNQYDSVAQFLVDTLRTPTIIGATISTHSPTQNLANYFPNIPAPLVIDFPKPRRMVGLYLGRATTGDPTDSAVLRAFDVDGYSMGEIDRLLPAPKDGINTFLGIGAIFPGRLISRIELEYQGPGVSAEGVQIDDLLLCTTKTEDPNPVTIPPVPDYGDINVKAKFQAWLITEDPNGQNEMNLIATPIQDPFLNVDGTLVEHDVEIDKQQAKTLNLSTPQSIPGAAFVHWEAIAGYGGATVFFNEGMNALSLPLLRATTFSAIYAPDGDGDGIPDLQVGESVDNCPMHANPGQSDNDGDGIGDICDLDDDNDGLPDTVEDSNGNGVVDVGETNPLDPDSDMDGLLDGIEDSNGNGAVDAGETDPLDSDSDDDGALDGEEDNNGNGVVDAGEADPLNFDSDGDGLTDGYEINVGGTDPSSSTTVYTDQCDMNFDGERNLGDLLLLQQDILGL